MLRGGHCTDTYIAHPAPSNPQSPPPTTLQWSVAVAKVGGLIHPLPVALPSVRRSANRRETSSLAHLCYLLSLRFELLKGGHA
eukprot:14230086-Alexandrium_andersonii.AAC.1